MEGIRTSGNRLFLTMEAWFNRAFGNRLNPFYHLGSLTFFFFWVVLVSGIYVFIFFRTSVDGAYASVEYMTHDQWWMAGVMRSLHRYASDAAIITIFLHLAREFFRDRYRGVRWFSWFTGVPTLWLVVLLGISGYWLVWDQMAQYIAMATAELVDWLPIVPGAMAFNFLDGQVTNRFFTLMAFLHLMGFPVALVFALWIHVSRISQVDFNPPLGLAVGSLLALVVVSLAYPAVSHGPADLSTSPTVLHLDWFYLNIYPVMDRLGPAAAWILSSGVTLLLLALPWLPPKRTPPAVIITLDQCNGCGQCALDCPFGAVSMKPRTDGRKHPFEPSVDPSLCTACGICVGACVSSNPFRKPKETLATGIDLPWESIDQIRAVARERIAALTGSARVLVVGCEHAADLARLKRPEVAVLTLPCVAMLPAAFMDFAHRQGADGVLITGCREGDCFFRFGNNIVEERLRGEREPHLSKRTDRDRIRVQWAGTPDQNSLEQALEDFRQVLSSGKGGDHD